LKLQNNDFANFLHLLFSSARSNDLKLMKTPRRTKLGFFKGTTQQNLPCWAFPKTVFQPWLIDLVDLTPETEDSQQQPDSPFRDELD